MKKKHMCVPVAALLLCGGAASALDVNCAPGQLSAAVGAQAATATTLAVTGAVNAADLEFVRYEMPALKSLDLSGATIASYSGAKLANGRFDSPAYTFPECALLGAQITSVTLPSNLTAIGDGAFASSDITSIEIPASVTTIGASAFADCDALERVAIPESVTEMGAGAFSRCASLTRADINGAMTDIPAQAFAGCTTLATVVLPPSVTTIGDEAFAQTAIDKIALSRCEGLRSVGKWAFAGCEKLEAVWMPHPVPELGQGAFFHNTTLVADISAMQGSSNAEMADYLYTGNALMTVNKFEDTSVSRIGDYALAGLENISEISLPYTVNSIGSHAMEGWTGLKVLKGDKLKSVPELGDEVWAGVNQSDVTLEVSTLVAESFKAAAQWQDFAIKAVSPTTLEEIVDSGAGARNVSGHFAGQILHLASTGDNIVGVQLYDLGGRMYALPANAPAAVLDIDTSAVDGGVWLVRVLLADGSVEVLKLNK